MKAIAFLCILSSCIHLVAQQSAPSQQPPQCLSAEEDRQQMMDQLGITNMRSGRSPDIDRPNAANYDESTAGPFDELPDPLILDNGKEVDSEQAWFETRRAEIVEHMERLECKTLLLPE